MWCNQQKYVFDYDAIYFIFYTRAPVGLGSGRIWPSAQTRPQKPGRIQVDLGRAQINHAGIPSLWRDGE